MTKRIRLANRLAGYIAICLLAAGVAGAAESTMAAGANQPYYCPPGAKYCPAPGSTDSGYIDDSFGMDPNAGFAATNPAPRYGAPQNQEVVLYAQPGANVSPNVKATASGRQPTQSKAKTAQKSEVASNRMAKAAPVAGDEDKVPWYKGGWVRNRFRKGEKEEAPPKKNQKQAQAKTDAKTSGSTGDEEDLWSDGADFSEPGFGDDFAAGPANQGFAQQPMNQQAYNGGQQAYSGTPTPGGVSEPYTIQGSPGATSPYPSGYLAQGQQPFDGYQQQIAHQPQPVFQSPSAPLPQADYGQPYATPQPYPAADPYAAPQSYPVGNDPFAMPPPPGQPNQAFAAPAPAYPQQQSAPPPAPFGAPVSGGVGGPQFEQAVRLIKDNRFTEAKGLLVAETSANPNNGAAWRWLGDCQYNLLELSAAIESYNRAVRLAPDDYYALRGLGFAHLHRGHELWRQMMTEHQNGQTQQAGQTFSEVHDNYKKARDYLGQCLQKAPNDSEAIYGKAMAAEGASRKLYSNAISHLAMGPANRQYAESFAENCLQVINEGIACANDRARQNVGESGPRALLGGLYLRKAMLYHKLGKKDLALAELKNSYDAQKSIIDDIDKNNATAQKGMQDCEAYLKEWTGSGAQ